MKNHEHRIVDVLPDGPCGNTGIQAGDYLLAVNGRTIIDILDYHFEELGEELTLTIRHEDGTVEDYEIEKDEDEEIGLVYAESLMDDYRSCRNRCIFCFIDQMHNLSVKVSYGEQGNDNLGTFYAWQSLYDLDYANGNNIGAIITSLENQEVSWEKNSNLNAGFEAALFDGRIRIDFEYFYKKTTDMLLEYPMALSTGFSGYYDNVGNMRNTGFELNLGLTPVRTQDFEWNLNFMANRTNNKVLKLTNESPEIISGIRVIKEGMPIYTYYMSKSAGVDPKTGAQLYWAYNKDENGNIVNEYITDSKTKANECKYYMGSRIPKLYGSIGTDLTWKGLSLSILTTYSIGGKIYDGLYESGMDLWYMSSTWHKNELRRWQKPGDITDVPRVEISNSPAANDRFLIDASYFSIKNITLAYSLPKAWMAKLGIQGIKVFGSADNVALFTHLNGMDPQYNFTGGTNYDYSPNKTYTIGVEVNF